MKLTSSKNAFSHTHASFLQVKASMTIEAALALPVFLIFVLSIFYVFQIIHIQTETYQLLHQQGNRAVHSGYQNYPEDDDGIVSLNVAYRITPYLLWQDFGQLWVEQYYYGYAWIGYKVGENGDLATMSDEEGVFITDTGTVYHLNRECTHLRLSIMNTDNERIADERNVNGGRYHPCERCAAVTTDEARLFITTQGTRYHGDINCSGLKRTVSVILQEEAVKNGMGACLRCG
ncbi:MAG: pilus assembly protein [Lachnospiraceae bacterium]|jgi:hypothetical protein|nr:pilus assembly protein [Lachnospiraceae bacterium]